MLDALTLTEITDALDTLADVMVSDCTDELAGHNASFWRDAVACLRRSAAEETDLTPDSPPEEFRIVDLLLNPQCSTGRTDAFILAWPLLARLSQ